MNYQWTKRRHLGQPLWLKSPITPAVLPQLEELGVKISPKRWLSTSFSCKARMLQGPGMQHSWIEFLLDNWGMFIPALLAVVSLWIQVNLTPSGKIRLEIQSLHGSGIQFRLVPHSNLIAVFQKGVPGKCVMEVTNPRPQGSSLNIGRFSLPETESAKSWVTEACSSKRSELQRTCKAHWIAFNTHFWSGSHSNNVYLCNRQYYVPSKMTICLQYSKNSVNCYISLGMAKRK